jgi:predicted GNAT superfamily acetyltransferase
VSADPVTFEIRTLSTLRDCQRVAALEKAIWGCPDADVIPAVMLIASLMRGGVLLGAFDQSGDMQGYVYAVPANKDGRATQWSHALGVLPDARGRGVGAALKIAQRQQALRAGVDLIEWTCDPLQAASAHLNFARLGVVVEEYVENLYGASASPLHGAAPTDRFVAEWNLRTPHVERRIAAAAPVVAASARRASLPISVRDSAVVAAIVVNPSRETPEGLCPGTATLDAEAARVLVEIPTNFSGMLAAQPDLAREWRMATRTIFQSYFGRGYRAVDFFLAEEQGRGQYLLARAAS